jgi:hypothetical protein
MANFYQTDDINFSIPFDFISDEFNGVTRDIQQSIPPLILDYVRQMLPRHYESFSQAAAENAASRIFLGIHWRFDAIEGVSAGDRIADIVFDTQLRPHRGHGPTHVASVDFAAQIDAYLNNTYTTYFSGGGGVAAASPAGLPDSSHNLDVTLEGLTPQRVQEVDAKVVDAVRNFLFDPPGAGGLDLASLNIQRGRDPGLPDNNTLREAFGLPRVTSFATQGTVTAPPGGAAGAARKEETAQVAPAQSQLVATANATSPAAARKRDAALNHLASLAPDFLDPLSEPI